MQITCANGYPQRHSGTALVVGGAPCAREDQERARDLCPEPFSVIAVNGAWPLVVRTPSPFAVVTCHADFFDKVYAVPAGVERHEYNVKPHKHELADFVWSGGGALCAGTSSLSAAIIAKAMGFETIVLCGVPLLPTEHAEGYRGKHERDEFSPRKEGHVNGLLKSRWETWSKHAKGGHLAGVYSMSGKTRDILGAPVWKV